MKSLLLSILFLFIFSLVHAQQPGTLDPIFGNKGTLIDQSVVNKGYEIVKVTKEGRILIGTAGHYQGIDNTFRIDALLPDGSPDLAFGEEGSAYVLFPGMMAENDNYAYINALALLPDGRILACGSLNVEKQGDIGFAQLKPNGAIDSSFGTNGTASASFGRVYESIAGIALQADGKIVIAGGESIKINGGGFGDYVYQFSTARFLPDGKKDISFGNNGIVINNTSYPYGYGHSVVIQKDGKIVSAGSSGQNSNNAANFHIERYNEDGSYDMSFGMNGIVDAKIEGSDVNVINDIALQSDGKIVATGEINNVPDAIYKFTTVRYNTNDSIDKSFGKDGIITNTFSQYSEGKKILITGEQEDKIVVAGSASTDGTGYDFAIVSYNIDGSLDKNFGNNGTQLTDLGGTDGVTSAALQTDGKILELGSSYSSETNNTYRALARYYGYPVKVSLIVRIKRWLHNHGITWNGLPAEDKIAYYSVEQSSSSIKGFAQVAKVSGKSNLTDYSITNSNLLKGMNYYRVKAVSTDGTIRYSEVVSADNTANTASVFPNPARDFVTVQGLQTNATANISIADGSGNVMAKGVSNGGTQYRSPLNNMQPGTYYINITTGSKTEVLKFVKE